MKASSPILATIKSVHKQFVFDRRTKTIAKEITKVLPASSTVLDIGCGDGTIDAMIKAANPGTKIVGLEFAPRGKAEIKVFSYDGEKIPFPSSSFDVSLIIDTLHHTPDPEKIIKEARRVTKKYIIIKDHFAQNFFDHLTLKLMDWVGNKPHAVHLLYNYWNQKKWAATWKKLNLKTEEMSTNLNLYPRPFNIIFDRKLHFLVKLKIED